MQRLVPAEYFLITFTVPAEFRALAFAHQETFYDLLLRCSWETLHTFSRNDKQLRGTPGAIAVLHTHTRKLDFHPHVHLVMPAAAVDAAQRQWRTKSRGKVKNNGKDKSQSKGRYLFNHKALAKVFRAKMLVGRQRAEGADLPGTLSLPGRHPGGGYRRLRRWSGDLPVSQRQNGETRTANRLRRAISVAGVAACAAERFPARP